MLVDLLLHLLKAATSRRLGRHYPLVQVNKVVSMGRLRSQRSTRATTRHHPCLRKPKKVLDKVLLRRLPARHTSNHPIHNLHISGSLLP